MHRFTATALLIAITSTTPGAAAQHTLRPEHGKPFHEPTLVSMNFPGGTMAEFVAALRTNHPKVNVIVALQARNVTIPATSLKNAGLAQTLESACMAAEGQYEIRVREFLGDGQPVYSIVANAKRRAGGRTPNKPAPPQVLSVYSLSELTMQRPSGVTPFSVETILSALQLAVAHLDSAPKMRFHEDSGLLLIAGTPEHARVSEQTLAALRRDLQTRDRSGFRGVKPRKNAK